MNKEQLLQKFSLFNPLGYHSQSQQRVAHFPSEQLRQAAVLIPFIERPHGLQIILTKRAEHLKHHPGQISFPGGKCEASDPSVHFTAQREAEEEIGLKCDNTVVFGELPQLTTVSRFRVTPVLAFVKQDFTPQIDSNEVASVFEVPAQFLLNPDNLYTHQVMLKHSQHRLFGFNYQGRFIWGMTAQILQALQIQLHPHLIDKYQSKQ